MGKSLNPADAHRRAQRKKEKARNKKQRQDTREVRQLLSDPSALRAEIARFDELAQKGSLDAASLRHKKNLELSLGTLIAKRSAQGQHDSNNRAIHSSVPMRAQPRARPQQQHQHQQQQYEQQQQQQQQQWQCQQRHSQHSYEPANHTRIASQASLSATLAPPPPPPIGYRGVCPPPPGTPAGAPPGPPPGPPPPPIGYRGSGTSVSAGAVRENPYARYIQAQAAGSGEQDQAQQQSSYNAACSAATVGPHLPPPARQVRKKPRVVEVDDALAAFVPTALRKAKRTGTGVASASVVQQTQRPAKRARVHMQQASAVRAKTGVGAPIAEEPLQKLESAATSPDASEARGEGDNANATEPFESFLQEIEEM